MARALTIDERDMLAELRSQILLHRGQNLKLDRYANAKAKALALGIRGDVLVPLDWPRKTIEVFANKLIPEPPTFPLESEVADVVAYAWAASNVAWVERQAIKSALRHGPAFVFTSLGDLSIGEPEVIVSVADARNATALVDWRTRRVTAAYEVLDHERANLYLPKVTLELDLTRNRVLEEHKSTERVRCAIYAHDPTLDMPFGRSRITPTVIGLTDAAARTLARQEVAAEFYQAPRPMFFGLSVDDLFDDAGRPVLEKAIGSGWAFADASSEDEISDQLRRARVEWAPQATMQPFSDQFRLQAAAMAAASSIPLQHLGVVQDSNPTSAEAIMAQEKPLVELAFAQQREFDVARRHLVWDIAVTVFGDEFDQAAKDVLHDVALRWQSPRHVSVSEMSQMVAMQVQVGNLPAGALETIRLLPIDGDDATALAAVNEQRAGERALATLTAAAANVPQDVAQMATKTDTGIEPTATPGGAEMKQQFDALGTAIRAGVDPRSAAKAVGLEGIEFTGAVPVSLRIPQSDAARLEE